VRCEGEAAASSRRYRPPAARAEANCGRGRIKEKYSLYFIHDAETQALVGFGDADSTGASVTFDVTMDMPSSGERAKPIRTVLRRLGPDRHVFEMFEKYMDGREWKVIEVTYRLRAR
jgi:hypothetical protein